MFNKNFNENCNCEYDCEFHGNCKACMDNHVKDAKEKICYTKLKIREKKRKSTNNDGGDK
ncbi:MAG: hypothetical protein FWE90_11430 [Defluviitaleaceae bacterium]|nr:hypothetical protein [Defluviitaleaceae bacterium]